MPTSRSLLERIDRGHPNAGVTRDPAAEATDSVIGHLRRMLNTRQGHVLTALDYGMPDFTGLAQSSDAKFAVQHAFFESIRKYEPRLKNVRVNHLETDGLEIRFEITATLVTQTKGVQVRIETSMEPSGRVRVD